MHTHAFWDNHRTHALLSLRRMVSEVFYVKEVSFVGKFYFIFNTPHEVVTLVIFFLFLRFSSFVPCALLTAPQRSNIKQSFGGVGISNDEIDLEKEKIPKQFPRFHQSIKITLHRNYGVLSSHFGCKSCTIIVVFDYKGGEEGRKEG